MEHFRAQQTDGGESLCTGEADIVHKALWEVRTLRQCARAKPGCKATAILIVKPSFFGADGCINAICKDIVFLQSFVHLAACFVAVICLSCAFRFILYATRVPQA